MWLACISFSRLGNFCGTPFRASAASAKSRRVNTLIFQGDT